MHEMGSRNRPPVWTNLVCLQEVPSQIEKRAHNPGTVGRAMNLHQQTAGEYFAHAMLSKFREAGAVIPIVGD